MMNWQAQLAKMGACEEALRWCRKFDTSQEGFVAAWKACKDTKDLKQSEWMTWLCMRAVNAFGIMPCEDRRIFYPADVVYDGFMGTKTAVRGDVVEERHVVAVPD